MIRPGCFWKTGKGSIEVKDTRTFQEITRSGINPLRGVKSESGEVQFRTKSTLLTAFSINWRCYGRGSHQVTTPECQDLAHQIQQLQFCGFLVIYT